MPQRGDFWLNVIVLYGSPHPRGNTSGLLGAFLSGLGEREAAAVTRFDAYGMNVRPCCDCGICRTQDMCAYGDMDGLDAALRSCGAMVIASPVYHSTFPAPLKAVFDRTQRYYHACRQGRTPFAGDPRPAYLLLAAGQKNEDGGVIKRQLRRILPTLNMTLAGSVVAGSTDLAPVGAEKLREARALALRAGIHPLIPDP